MKEPSIDWLDGDGRSIHFAGICGVGMAGLAGLLSQCNWRVSGCDANPDAQRSQWLQSLGITLEAGHDPRHITPGLEALVATPALAAGAPERNAATEIGIPVLSRGKVLAELLSSMRGVAVCGSHGKTTTSCFTASLLHLLGVRPAWCIGGKTGMLGAVGGSETPLGPDCLLVAESDESDGTLALYRPEITVVNTVDIDHVDFFPDEESLISCFRAVASQTRGGIAVCADSPRAMRACEEAKAAKLTFALDNEADLTARNIATGGNACSFVPVFQGREFPAVKLPYSGRHNILNALAAAGAAILLGHSPSRVFGLLSEACSQLPDRRFQKIGEWRGATVITDYAHHPEELRAMQCMANELKPQRMITVFQPHRYSRTKAFIDDFPSALSGADETVLLPVYAASELPIPGGTSADLYRRFREENNTGRIMLAQSLDEAEAYLKTRLRQGDLLMLAGAGSVVKLGDICGKPEAGELDLRELEDDNEIALRRNAPLRHCNFYRCGGEADCLATANSIDAIRKIASFAERNGIALNILGLGANTWIPDSGMRGITLNLAQSRWGEIVQSGDDTIEIPCHITAAALLRYCEESGLSGLEMLDSIPGTVGGLLTMNAGAFGFSIGEIVETVKCIERDGSVAVYHASECGFSYRTCSLLQQKAGRIAVGCTMRLARKTSEEIRRNREAVRAKRLPLQGLRCEGSVFRNPEGDSAGRLLEAAGCKNLRVGGARVCGFHANIIATEDEACSSDVLALIQLMQAKVFERSGILLEPEIRGLDNAARRSQ